jgi:hypothetical protein
MQLGPPGMKGVHAACCAGARAAGGLALPPLGRERAAAARLEQPILHLDVSLAVYRAGSDPISCLCGQRVASAAAGFRACKGAAGRAAARCVPPATRPARGGSSSQAGRRGGWHPARPPMLAQQLQSAEGLGAASLCPPRNGKQIAVLAVGPCRRSLEASRQSAPRNSPLKPKSQDLGQAGVPIEVNASPQLVGSDCLLCALQCCSMRACEQ